MSRFNVTRVTAEIGDSTISFETGKLAKQASGAVVVRSGDTMVLNTATIGGLRDVDFLPLTVDVEERMYAAGKIPGSFFRREGKSSEKATLTARMIDRPIRPLFPKGWHFETQLVAMPMSVDGVNPYDILAMNGASAALSLSGIPFDGPVGAVRVGLVAMRSEDEPLARDFLARLEGATRARVVTDRGPTELQLARLDQGALDLVLGDFTSDSPWLPEVAVVEPIVNRPAGDRSLGLSPVAANGENRWVGLLEKTVRDMREDAHR